MRATLWPPLSSITSMWPKNVTSAIHFSDTLWGVHRMRSGSTSCSAHFTTMTRWVFGRGVFPNEHPCYRRSPLSPWNPRPRKHLTSIVMPGEVQKKKHIRAHLRELHGMSSGTLSPHEVPQASTACVHTFGLSPAARKLPVDQCVLYAYDRHRIADATTSQHITCQRRARTVSM